MSAWTKQAIATEGARHARGIVDVCRARGYDRIPIDELWMRQTLIDLFNRQFAGAAVDKEIEEKAFDLWFGSVILEFVRLTAKSGAQ